MLSCEKTQKRDQSVAQGGLSPPAGPVGTPTAGESQGALGAAGPGQRGSAPPRKAAPGVGGGGCRVCGVKGGRALGGVPEGAEHTEEGSTPSTGPGPGAAAATRYRPAPTGKEENLSTWGWRKQEKRGCQTGMGTPPG